MEESTEEREQALAEQTREIEKLVAQAVEAQKAQIQHRYREQELKA